MLASESRHRSEVYRVGMVIPLQGPGGIFGPSCMAVSDLAGRELNSGTGFDGREVQLEYIDGGRDPRAIAAEVSAMVDAGRLDAVSGWHISSIRRHLAPVVRGRIPYMYTSLYEGGEVSSNVYCSGESPEQQIYPAMRWLRDHHGVRSWYVVGADYIWPLRTHQLIEQFAAALGLDIVGSSFVPMGRADDPQLPATAAQSGCHAVLTLLVGQDAVDFNRHFAARDLHHRILRFSPLMEENMLLAGGAETTENLFASAAYFRTLHTESSLRFIGDYVDANGHEAPALNNMAESCYQGVYALSHLARRAGGLDPDRCDAQIDGLEFDSPRGVVRFDGNQARQQIYMAQASGLDFEVVATL
ncbi:MULTISPECIES: substrate-binding domain-containing protein [unclassified Rhodococcus (in: high G+C Gram-positive bacteria)]|uniref:substrate-binding domain-containing protein n=1 Tax=unclassified Rhodococcus (in: high G+C Gram-positive bacteria) TaxID=192944 RepID=UPI0009EA9F77|nr:MULTISPECIES: substrate-binding domain-containing protein [unclassified Rhodococcus (in: high G+C Gram-positive bacteria)]